MITNTKNNDVTMIKLDHLFLSEHNVRVAPASKQDNKTLKASIKANGIKQNLVVVPEGSKYGVVAGGRRLAQLHELLADGDIKSSFLVPCMVEKAENIRAISLSENIKASMHPADEFVAFQGMVDEGKTVADIANEFGISQVLVKKRLKMAGVSVELLDYYRQGKIDLEHIMAFTVTDDHERQMACYKELSTHYMSVRGIRNFLLDTALLTSHGMVKLVGLKAFKKAGGTTTTDLFEEATYINERELLETLALDILNKKAKSLAKQWKWVDVVLSASSYRDYETTLTAELVGVPEKLITDLKAKEDAIEALEDKNYADWTDEDEDLETQLHGEIETLENEREQYRHFSDEQKAVSGAMVSFDSEGKIFVKVGYVKKEDISEAFPPSDTDESGEGTKGELVSSSDAVESNALKIDLSNFRLQALQSEIMKDDKLTYDLMVYSLAKQSFSDNHWCEKPLNTTIEASNLCATNGIDETQPHQTITKYKDSLELAWLLQDTETDKFKDFRELSSVQKKRLLSYCTAMSYRASTDINPFVSEAIEFDIAMHWTPTKDNYFKRIKTADLLSIGAKQINEQWAVDNAKRSKGQIVDILESHDDMADWMPESMQ